jgi:hypothetical protein
MEEAVEEASQWQLFADAKQKLEKRSTCSCK